MMRRKGTNGIISSTASLLPYPYVHLSLSSYLLYYYVVAIVPASAKRYRTYSTQTMPTAYCRLCTYDLPYVVCGLLVLETRD